MKSVWVFALVLVLMASGRLYADKTAHVVKPEKTILLSVWLKARTKADLAVIAKDRMELRHLAGRSGVESRRLLLLRQIGICRREIVGCKQHRMPHFPSIVGDNLPSHVAAGDVIGQMFVTASARTIYRFRPGQISLFNDDFVIHQILGPHSALCMLSGVIEKSDGRLGGRLVRIDGLDFSSLTTGMDVFAPDGLCQVGKPFTYTTVTGATNTITELHPVKMINDTMRHPPTHPGGS